MNWFLDSSWLWQALRGRSVTFAALFAFSALGLSVVRIFRHFLAAIGAPWLLLFILPIVMIGTVARREREWMPDEELRSRWSRRLILGAIAASVVIGFVAPKPPPAAGNDTRDTTVRMHRPSGK